MGLFSRTRFTPRPEVITLDQVKAAAQKVVSANPNAINPRDADGRCLYTQLPGDTTPNAAEHCLAGAVLLELGLSRMPLEFTMAHVDPEVINALSESAIAYLTNLQKQADVPENTWSVALANLGNYRGE